MICWTEIDGDITRDIVSPCPVLSAPLLPYLFLLILLFILFFFTPLFSTLFFPLSTDLLQYLCSVDDYLNTQTKYHSYS